MNGFDTGGCWLSFPPAKWPASIPESAWWPDPPWNTSIVRMAARAKSTVVLFDGRNGLGFQMAGMGRPRLRTVLLTRIFLNKSGKTLVLRVGNLLSPTSLESFASDEERTEYLRRKTFVLANRQDPMPPLPFPIPLGQAFGKSRLKAQHEPSRMGTDP